MEVRYRVGATWQALGRVMVGCSSLWERVHSSGIPTALELCNSLKNSGDHKVLCVGGASWARLCAALCPGRGCDWWNKTG